MKAGYLIVCALLLATAASAQKNMLNIPAMHQLIGASESEFEKQNDARNRQTLVTANERANLTLLEKTKYGYRRLQQCFNTLGMAISAAEIGMNAIPMLNRIVSNQEEIIRLARQNPVLVAIGYEAEIAFISRANGLIRYVTGLTLSIGDINQMKVSDRKILFDYVLRELSVLQELSGNLLNLLQYSRLADLLKTGGPFRDFVNTDKQIIGEILQNAKYLK